MALLRRTLRHVCLGFTLLQLSKIILCVLLPSWLSSGGSHGLDTTQLKESGCVILTLKPAGVFVLVPFGSLLID